MWRIRRPIRGKHLRGKYRAMAAAFAELEQKYLEVCERLNEAEGHVRDVSRETFIVKPTIQDIAKVSQGGR